jgi:hypothetical protein
MKTAGRENPNRWGNASSNRAHGAELQNRSCSIMWAGKQEKVRPLQECFFLTFLFIERVQQPSTWRGTSEQILLNHVGWEARKSPAVAGVFFLDFPFYRTYKLCFFA